MDEKTPLIPTADDAFGSPAPGPGANANQSNASDNASSQVFTNARARGLSPIDSGSSEGSLSQAAASMPISPASAPTASSTANKSKFRVGLDAAVLDNQRKWKRLVEINDDNSTAKSMASEIQQAFADLRQQNQQQQELQQQQWLHDSAASDPTNQQHQQQQPQLFSIDVDDKKTDHPLQWYYASMDANADKYLIAAAFIRDGIHGRKIGYRLDRTALVLHELFHSLSYHLVYTLVVLLNCSMAFFESPGSPNSTLLALDICCLVIFAVDVYIRWTMSSNLTKSRFITRQPWAYVRGCLVAITLIDLIVFICFPRWNPNRYSRALRPFFVIARRRNIRIIFGSCLRALREVVIVLLLLFALVGFFGLLGYLLFSDLSDPVNAPFFSSLGTSMYTMLLIHNCLPYMPRAMLPYFEVTEWTSVYFVIFVLITNLFLAKLTIAVSYKSYKQHTEQMLYKRLQKRKAALYAAFDILSEEVDLSGGVPCGLDKSPPRPAPFLKDQKRSSSSFLYFGFNRRNRSSLSTREASFVNFSTPIQCRRISHDTWLLVCEILKPNWSHIEASLVFNTIDIEHVGFLDLTDFYQLCSLLSIKVERPYQSCFTRLCPSMKRNIKKWQVRTKNVLLYERIMFGYPVVLAELFVGCLICLSVLQAIQVNNRDLAYSVNSNWRVLGFVLLCLFTVEVLLKLFAFETSGFFSRPFCKLDLSIAIVGWCFYVASYHNPTFPLVFYDLALAVRSLRIFKLLNLVPPFHQILYTLKRIMPLILQLLLVILSVTYAFAIVTQAFYGQLLAEFPPAKQNEVPQWYAVRQEFQVDTFQRTLVTLFGVANLAGWDIVMDAAHTVTGSNWTYVFFFAYRMTISNILLPIFVGFLVESFTSNSKTVENTIQTYVEAAEQKVALREEKIERQRQQHLRQQHEHNQLEDASAPPSQGFSYSPQSSMSDHQYRMRLEKRTSVVHNEMFDAVKLSDLSRLKLLIEKKDEELEANESHVRKLEANVLSLQNRLNQSQQTIIAHENKIRNLTNQVDLLEMEKEFAQSTRSQRGSWRPW